MTQPPKCDTCDFWQRNYFGSGWQRSGQCRKYAPRPGKPVPDTYEDFWCAEHSGRASIAGEGQSR